ncbi:MAG: FAD-containing monooxygenase EthA [Bacteroidetes bacterium]|nr:MAG: FAD-containing monooxygenase EthA [Bacteroidota bacterium]
MNPIYFDTLIVGAGISGISAAHYLQTDCPTKTYAMLEGRKNIGGTWDLFRYPGIRSDSDMYTFGFAFRPWTNPKAIAPRELILEYLEDTIQAEGIDQHILFEHRVTKVSWSSETARWTVTVSVGQLAQPKIFTCSFLSLCTGYYSYEAGYTPVFPGRETFKGTIVHPQKWPAGLDYSNQRIVVIGSGATAVTLVPALAAQAAHVTLLQRSPTYVVSQPAEDKIAKWLHRHLSAPLAYRINRWLRIRFQRYSYALARAYPKTVKKLLIRRIKKILGNDFDVATHFTPSYDPWDQRVCLVPDDDLFLALKAKKATIVTDQIAAFTPTGIQLASGRSLDADIIVTATGLAATVVCQFPVEVDGELVDFSQKVSYKGAMFSDIPNLTQVFGYTNASWTLKCDLVSQYVCRLINYMDQKGYHQACPRQHDPTLELVPFFDFTPGYLLRILDSLPKLGATMPWRLEQNYFHDQRTLLKDPLDDGVLECR